jgi:hypothetical protein
MDVFSFVVFCGFLAGIILSVLVANIAASPTELDAVQHGYGQWCPDRSFAWQHEECE